MKRRLLLFVWCITGSALHAFAPVNFYRPDDSILRLPKIRDRQFTLGAKVEVGSAAHGRSWQDVQRNVLALHDDVQKSAHMLLNPVSFELVGASPYTDFIVQVLEGSLGNDIEAIEQSQRGYVNFQGDFAGADLTLFSSWGLSSIDIPGRVSLDCYLPVQSKRIRNVRFTDQTPLEGDDATDVGRSSMRAQNFNKNLAANIATLGIDAFETNSTGIGDLHILLSWLHTHERDCKWFSECDFYAKAGIVIPTGKQSSTKKIFAMPLGYDGSWGFPLGFGVQTNIRKKFVVGLYGDFLYLGDKTKTRRVKTSKFQSEFLLINTAFVQKSNGFTWQLRPFLQLLRFRKNFSLTASYQYIRHEKDKYRLKDREFGTKFIASINRDGNISSGNENLTAEQTINTANSLRRWDVHNMVFQVNWDMARDVHDAPGAPQLSLFYKRALGGRNIIDVNTFGGELAFNF